MTPLSIFPFLKIFTIWGVFWGNDAPPVPWVPGVAFPVQHGTRSISKISPGGTGGQKTGPLFSRVPRGYPFRGERGAVFPKKYRLGIWRKKSGRNVVPWFSGKSQVHVCHETWIVLYFGKLKFTIFYSLLCYKTNNNNVVLYYKRESNIEHARRYNETREWFCRFR